MTDGLRLAALLAHPANGGLRLISGPAGVPWRQAVFEAGEAELSEDGAGSLAILTAELPTEPWRQDALLRRVRDRGYAAIALPSADRAGPGTRRLADRIGLALLQADRPIELAKACWELVQARDALTLGYVRKVAQSFEYPAQDLSDLLRHIASNLGHGIALTDAAGVVGEAGGHLDDELRASVDATTWIDIARAGGAAAASVRVDSPGRTGLRLAVFGDGLGDAQLQALAVAAEIAMPAVAARILIDEVAAVSDASVSSGLLRDFTDLRGVHDGDVERRMLERGWRTSGYHLGFRMIGRSRLDALDLLRWLTGELGGLGTESHLATSGRGVSGWLSFTEPPSAREVESAVGALRELHTAARRLFNVATGVGSLQSGSAGLTTTLSEATDAARIAVNRSATGWFVRVDGLGLEQLLMAWTGNDTFVPAAQSLLAPLRESGGELLATLSAYLDHESGIAATAAALGLHRNTVSARIQRAQELLGVDMEDPETRLALHLACRAVLG